MEVHQIYKNPVDVHVFPVGVGLDAHIDFVPRIYLGMYVEKVERAIRYQEFAIAIVRRKC